MEINEVIRDKKWEDAVALFHPLDEKFPDLVTGHLNVPLREKIGFVLGQLKKYDEALKAYGTWVQKSVFECASLTEEQFLKMKHKIEDCIDNTRNINQQSQACIFYESYQNLHSV